MSNLETPRVASVNQRLALDKSVAVIPDSRPWVIQIDSDDPDIIMFSVIHQTHIKENRFWDKTASKTLTTTSIFSYNVMTGKLTTKTTSSSRSIMTKVRGDLEW